MVDVPTDTVYNKWILTITLWPKVCAITGRRIPMYSKAYCKLDGLIETWVEMDEFIIARLKDEI